MTESVIELERVSMVQGPYDYPHMYEIFEGVLYDCQYFFYLENGILSLRHVKKVEQSYHTHLYLDGGAEACNWQRVYKGKLCKLSRRLSNAYARRMD